MTPPPLFPLFPSGQDKRRHPAVCRKRKGRAQLRLRWLLRPGPEVLRQQVRPQAHLHEGTRGRREGGRIQEGLRGNRREDPSAREGAAGGRESEKEKGWRRRRNWKSETKGKEGVCWRVGVTPEVAVPRIKCARGKRTTPSADAIHESVSEHKLCPVQKRNKFKFFLSIFWWNCIRKASFIFCFALNILFIYMLHCSLPFLTMLC